MADSIKQKIDVVSISGSRKTAYSNAHVYIETVEQYGANLTVKEAKKLSKILKAAIKKAEGKA